MSHKITMTNPLAGYHAYKDEIDQAIERILESGWYILGEEVSGFEEEFANFCGSPHAVGVASGTDAILLALRSLEVGPGDAVFTVSHTAVATVAAIKLTGATPVLVDIDHNTYTIDPQKLEDSIQAFDQPGLKPRAVVGVHIYGHPFDISSITDICSRHELLLVEDCAQAHGATYQNKLVGSFGDAGAFSFYPTKNLAAFGDGGAVLFQQMESAKQCKSIRQYGWQDRYLSEIHGTNSRLDELQAVILRIRLKYLMSEITVRRKAAQRYNKALENIVIIPNVSKDVEHAYHLYVIRTKDRDKLIQSLAEQEIGAGIHYPKPVHLQLAYQNTLRGAGGLAVTESISNEILSLPMHGFLQENDTQIVINAVSDWVERSY